MAFVQYELGAVGKLAVECQNQYLYAYGETGDYHTMILGRVPRGSNVQLPANWSYYIGALGGNPCTAANWQTSSTGATVIQGNGGDVQPGVIYIGGGFGYLMTKHDNDSNQYFYTSQSITGPWSLAYFENNSTGTGFNFPDPMLVTLKLVPGGYVVTICYSEAYPLDNGMGNTLYSAHFRTLKFSDNPNRWLLE
jgi:hypothetical protein